MLRQWLAQILLGAINIEQSKLLNTAHISLMLCGGLYKDLRNQRIMLGEMATEEVTRTVLRTNARQVGIQDQSDFYLDPHTKHYTGEKNVLKGWCSGSGCVDKACTATSSTASRATPSTSKPQTTFLTSANAPSTC